MAVVLSITFLFCILFGRYFQIQVLDEERLGYLALDQWTREIPVLSKRGEIYDRNGILLAGNTPSYSVFVRRNAVKEKEKVIETLTSLFLLDEGELRSKFEKKVSEFCAVKRVSKEEIVKLESYALDGVYYSPDHERYYPYRSLLCQVLGFTSSDLVGVSGLEKKYDKYLKGTNGEILQETDLVGVEIGSALIYKEGEEGLDLTLTVDYRIQSLLERVMGEAVSEFQPKSAECLVLDVNTFEILGMATLPSYDLNDIPREDSQVLTSLSRNGIVSNSYEPGSTFKVITSAINLEEHGKGNPKAYAENYVFNGSRTRNVDGTTVKCWSDHANGKHQNQTLREALNNSCNPCFTDIALSIGTETFYEYLAKFGFGSVTGIDFPGEALGMLLPSSAVRSCDLARIGFGQTIAVTAIQLACAVSSCINGGYYYVPHLVKEIGKTKIEPDLKARPISEKTSETLRSMLEGVVRDGSGKKAFIEGYQIGGKTGTAQKYENGRLAVGKYVSSFIGFYPADQPKYLTLVIIDEPQGAYYGSVVASPLAREVFRGLIAIEEGKTV